MHSQYQIANDLMSCEEDVWMCDCPNQRRVHELWTRTIYVSDGQQSFYLWHCCHETRGGWMPQLSVLGKLVGDFGALGKMRFWGFGKDDLPKQKMMQHHLFSFTVLLKRWCSIIFCLGRSSFDVQHLCWRVVAVANVLIGPYLQILPWLDDGCGFKLDA